MPTNDIPCQGVLIQQSPIILVLIYNNEQRELGTDATGAVFCGVFTLFEVLNGVRVIVETHSSRTTCEL